MTAGPDVPWDRVRPRVGVEVAGWIRAYEGCGFRRVGVDRPYDGDPG